ncbi:hypothetical protein LINGRAHAP2_LOCUS20219, partial [Linum grandiflorum]
FVILKKIFSLPLQIRDSPPSLYFFFLRPSSQKSAALIILLAAEQHSAAAKSPPPSPFRPASKTQLVSSSFMFYNSFSLDLKFSTIFIDFAKMSRRNVVPLHVAFLEPDSILSFDHILRAMCVVRVQCNFAFSISSTTRLDFVALTSVTKTFGNELETREKDQNSLGATQDNS